MFKFFPSLLTGKLLPIITIDCCRQLQVARLLHLVKHCLLFELRPVFFHTLCLLSPAAAPVSFFFLFQIQISRILFICIVERCNVVGAVIQTYDGLGDSELLGCFLSLTSSIKNQLPGTYASSS